MYDMMKSDILNLLIKDYPQLKENVGQIEEAYRLLEATYALGGKVLVCGNGGSAADSEHIVGELMKGFKSKRPLEEFERDKLTGAFKQCGEYLADNLQGALPAISLVSQSAFAYAYINDVAPDMVFAQQVYGYGKPEDVLIGLSTSGNSKNVENAIKVAKALGLKTIGMTGQQGGDIKGVCNVTITVPAMETYKVQEYHLPIYHALCAMLEKRFFG